MLGINERRVAVVVLLLCSLLANSVVFAGSISGRVTRESNGAPIPDLWVYAWDYDTGNWGDSGLSNANGVYEITGLAGGTYRLRVDTWNTDYVQEYYDDQLGWDDADPVAVIQGQATSGIDFQLAIGGSISGIVTDSNGILLQGVQVSLYRGKDPLIADEHDWYWVDNPTNPATTDATGEYQFTGLAERRYHINICGQEVSGTGYFETDLYNVQVFAGIETLDMNFELREAALIYGYVRTAGGTPIPVPDAWVVTEASWTQYGRDWHNAWTDSSGRYEFWVAPSPGKFYPVWVREASLGAVSYECKWDGNFYKATFAGTQVPDYELEVGGTVTGRVENESGEGIAGVQVESGGNKYGSDIRSWAETDSDGDFELGGLPTGTNYIYLENNWREIEQGGVKYMVGEAYAGPINITAGDVCDVGTFTIYEAGIVTGIVTDEAGLPIVGVEVELEGKDIDGNWADREDVISGAFGQFTIDYVAPGTYVLTCEKNGFIMGLETDIVVGRGEHVDLDVVLKSSAEGASISGRITNYSEVASYDSDGVQLPCYEDSDYDDFGYPELELLAVRMDKPFTEEDYLDPIRMIIAWVDEDKIDDGYGDYFEEDTNETPGSYEMTLPSGDIAIGMCVFQESLPGWRGCVILHDWKRFNLAKGDVVDDVNFTAVTANTGTLKGELTVPAGYDYFPEDWCLIYAYALDSENRIKTAIPLGDAVAFPGWTTTYEFGDLPAGNYTLKAYATNLASVIVPSVTVTASGTTTQDIEFEDGSTLKGHITDADSGIDVNEAVVTIKETGRQAFTDDLGNYTITGINAGIYTVQASASGYADAEVSDVNIGPNSTVILDFALDPTVGSISGTVKINAPGEPNLNGATVLAYNETDDTFKTAETVGGIFYIPELTPGQYILAVDADNYGVVVYPEGSDRITLLENQDVDNISIMVETVQPPVFTVHSTVAAEGSVILSMEFHSEPNLIAEPDITVVEGSGSLGGLTSNTALNRFEVDYAVAASDDIVLIQIAETAPLVAGSPASKTFTFEVGSNLVQTSSTNVTNAMGGKATIMGTQDNTEIYVPPFAIVGANDAQALTLTIERYGDPGDAVSGTSDTSVSAVYDFEFDEGGVSIDVDHTFTVTMSFQLPEGMTTEEFEDSLEIRYFDAGAQQWKTDGISNVRINWANSTIMFDISHLTKFAAFVESELSIGTISIKKCTVKAGKTAGKDMILVLGQLDATEDDLYDANDIQVTVNSSDMPEPYVASFPVNEKTLKKGKYNSARTENASRMLFKLNTKNGKFLFMAKKIDLTGLSCPVSIEVEIGSYVAEGQIDEDIVNGPKRSIPIQLMMGVKNILRVDKHRVKFGKKTSTDSFSIKGAFALENASNPIGNVVVTLGSQTFTVPSDKMIPYPNGEKCTNVDVGNGIVSAKFDVAKCTFIINIKKTSITDYGLVDFGIECFGNNLESTEKIDLGPKSSYGLEELRRYDVLGAWWDYQGYYTIKGPGLNEHGSGYATVSVSNSPRWVDGHECSVVNVSGEGGSTSSCWYTDANGTHQMGWGSLGGLGGFEITMDSLMVAPTVLRVGQQHTASGPFEGTYDIDNPNIDVDWFRGQVKSTYRLVGHEQVDVPAGPFNTVKCKSKLGIIGEMYIRYEDYYEQFEGIVKFNAVIDQTWWGTPGVGIVKSITNMRIKLSAKGMGGASIKITETDELTDYGP